MYIVQRTSFQLQTKNPTQSTLHEAHCTLHNARSTLHIARRSKIQFDFKPTARCTMHKVHCTIHEGLKCNSISNTAMTHFTLIWESFSFFRVEAIIRPLHFSFNSTVIYYFHVGIFFSKGSITKSFSHLAS